MRKISKKILSILLVVAMIVSYSSLAIMTNAAETEISISTAEDFNNIRNNLSGNYKLTSNIDLSSFKSWTPIGSDETPFTGSLDGNGYSICNLKINSSDIGSIGLFGSINNANLKKIIIKDADYQVKIGDYNDTKFSNVGGLSGTTYNSTIDCCSFSGKIIHSVGDYVYCRTAGITGSACNTTISNSYVNATISGSAKACNTMVAGVSTWLDNVTINKCYVAGSITANNDTSYTYAGGFSASANSASIWGWIYSYGGTVQNSVNLLSDFNVTGSEKFSDSIGNFIQSYSNKTISPTSADATTVGTYSSLGWDFTNVWKIDGGLPEFVFIASKTLPTGYDFKEDSYNFENPVKKSVSNTIRLYMKIHQVRHCTIRKKIEANMDFALECHIPLHLFITVCLVLIDFLGFYQLQKILEI